MKVLIVSYNPLTLLNNGGKYILSLFSEFSEDEMCQLYVHDTFPDKKRCHCYYRITDHDVVRNLAGKTTHHELLEYEIDDGVLSSQQRTSVKSNNRYLKLLIRDFVWIVSPWKNAVYKWVEKEKPDCIFSDTGDSCFLYDISLHLSKKYSLPIISAFGDDYYAINAKSTEVVHKMQLFFLRKKIKEFVNMCDKVITINDLFAQYYRTQFQLSEDKVITLANGSNFQFSEQSIKDYKTGEIQFSYLGNLSLGRGDNLLDIGRALEKYNQKNGTAHSLNIYAKASGEFLKKCEGKASIHYNGFVTGDDFLCAINSADVLIHTESFSEENIAQTRLSLSTKIADSLNSGKCLLAYGPPKIASMRHLVENNCAFVIDSPAKLEERMGEILRHHELRSEYSARAKRTALQYHDSKINSGRLRQMYMDLIR